MTTWTQTLTGGSSPNGHRLELTMTQNSQNVAANTSNVTFTLALKHVSGSPGSFSGLSNPWSSNFNGTADSGNTTYDFTGSNIYGTLVLDTLTTNITHNSDGTKSVTASGSFNATGGSIGAASIGTQTLTLTTIPRATTPTISGGNTITLASPGPTNVTINHSPASSSFSHVISYVFGGASGTIASPAAGVTSSVWAAPASLMAQIPNASSGTGTLTLVTKSGSTTIGTKTLTFTIQGDSTFNPTWSSVTAVEAVTSPNVNTIVGKFVQGVSKVTGTITGAAGIQSATITKKQFTVSGQTVTIPSTSATTGNVLSTSGAAVPVVFTITDSRGKTKTSTVNLDVLAWSTPKITSATIQRALSTGVADPNGTWIRVVPNVSVSSLINTTQRNTLTLKAYTSPRGANTWTLRATPVSASTTVTNTTAFWFDQSTLPFDVSTAYDVKLELTDQFATSSVVGVLPVASIFQHWGTGLGVNKYWQQDALDVGGNIRVNAATTPSAMAGDVTADGRVTSASLRLTTTTDLSLTSTGHAFQIGPDTGVNVGMDGNEMQARNNGAASQMNINLEGGAVTIGSTIAPAQIAVRGYFIQPELPDPLVSVGPNAFTITAAAATFASVTGMSTLSFGTLPRSLMVEVQFSGQAATTSATSYTRIGVATSGGLVTTATQDGNGNDSPGFTPFSANLDTTSMYGSMTMTIPTASTTFTFQAMRLLATGTNSIGYAIMKVIPLRWI